MATTTTRLSDGGYVETFVLGNVIHAQKYTAGGDPVGPEYVTS